MSKQMASTAKGQRRPSNGVGQGERIWARVRLFGDAVPNILDELEAILKWKIAVV